jgi:hypothetical protein
MFVGMLLVFDMMFAWVVVEFVSSSRHLFSFFASRFTLFSSCLLSLVSMYWGILREGVEGSTFRDLEEFYVWGIMSIYIGYFEREAN